jgi:hypothetical protein
MKIKFQFPGLSGYVIVDGDKITCHGADKDAKYMKKLVEIAKDFVERWRNNG